MVLPLCISTWLEPERPDEERFGIIARSGFQGVSLWIHKDLEPTKADGPAEALIQTARKAGLIVPNIHTPYDNCSVLWQSDQVKRYDQEVFFSQYIDLASRMKVPVVVIHVTEGDDAVINEYGLDSVRRMAKYAEKRGVVLAVENTIDNRVIDHLFSNIDSPGLGLCYDSSHDALFGRPLGAVLKRWGTRLAATHFSDNNGTHDDHILPGRGNIDFLTIASTFPFLTYDGPIQLEVHPHQTQEKNLETFCVEAARRARKLRSLMTGETIIVDWMQGALQT